MNKAKWGVLMMVAATSLTAGCATICRTDGGHVVSNKSIYFDVNSAAIRSAEREDIRTNVANLKANPHWQVVLEGNADPRGTDGYNYKLGMKRSQAVYNALVNAGVSKSRIRLVSNGKRNDGSNCDSESCWREDRRVDMVVLD